MNPLQENYYQSLLKDIEAYSGLVSSDVIQIICERLKKVGELNPTSARQIVTMAKEMDIDMRAIKKAIAKRMGMTLREVDRVFDKAAMDSAELAMALAKNQAGIVNMTGIERLARAAASRCKETILNLSDTFGFKMGKRWLPVRSAYIAVVNKATLAVQTGALDYDSAIREEVKRLSDAGLSVVEWDSGYHRRLDSSVRMNVMEGVRQMNQEILAEAGEKFANGVEISAHDRPAPDHADIQGKQFTKEEYEKLNASLKRPIGTLNCMHIAFPIIYGVTEPSYTDEELRTMKENANKKYIWKGKELNGYECTQKQREYETEIRKAQDREKALRAAGDKEGADREHKRAVDLRKEYRAFSEHVGLKEKLNRTGTAGKPIYSRNMPEAYSTVAESEKNDMNITEQTMNGLKREKPQYVHKSRVVDVMRKEYAPWSANLSKKELHALRKYTKNSLEEPEGKFYQRLNAMLRGDIPEDPVLRDYAETISGALKRQPLQKNIVCYRNVSIMPFEGLEVGEIIDAKQFYSTSVIPTRVIQGEYGITIYAHKGTVGAYVGEISRMKKQREFLIDKDCRFRLLLREGNDVIVEVVV